MPVEIIYSAAVNGIEETIPHWDKVKVYAPLLATLGAIKFYFKGASNTWERDMHGKVYMVTGGTSGIGGQVARELASKGAQVILLVRSTEDQWLVDYVDDMREATNSFLIYAEQCDLNSLYSIRKFATKWLDNQPPRRLDGVVCCAADCIPVGKLRQITEDGVERQLGINYLAHYHLLTLLAPSLRSQPPDRDVRVLLASCSLQALGDIDVEDLVGENKRYVKSKPYKYYGTSKLLLSLFGKEFQRRCAEYERKDKAPCNVKINMVNPGIVRTASTRRFLSMGTIWGLILYLFLYPIWLLFLKNAIQGAQSFFFALWAPQFLTTSGGKMVAECKVVTPSRKEFHDAELQKTIFDKTEQIIARLEKQSAIERKRKEMAGKTKEERLQEAKERHLKNLKKKQDILEKPESVSDLEVKLSYLRNLVKPDMPLFPDKA